jgi:Phage tail lysozyme
MPVPANAKQIYTLLVAGGLSPNAAAGIVGNIEQESGGEPGAGNYPGNYGLIQWTPANQSTYTVPDDSSVATQVGYIFKYIAANGSIEDINTNSPNPSAAALYFSTKYERPLASAANNPNREQSAVEVAQAATSGNWPQSPGLTTGGAASGDTSADISSPLGDIGLPSDITSLLKDADTFVNGLMWLVNPQSWMRIGAFIIGFALLLFAIYAFVRVSDGGPLLPSAPTVVPVPV